MTMPTHALSAHTSVVLPMYNASATLPSTLASLRGQTDAGWQLVAVDDGSSDGSAELLARIMPEATLLRQANAGPAAARNAALRVATTPYVAFLDADDCWPSDKLVRQRRRLESEPETGVVIGRVQYQAEAGATLPPMRFGPDQTVVCVHLGAGLYRRTLFDAVGLFDTTLRFSEDHDWFLRARERGVALHVEAEIGLIYRVHETNMTRGRTLGDLQLLEVLKRSLDRRRGAPTDRAPTLAPYDSSRREATP